jgi:hypothetical protein
MQTLFVIALVYLAIGVPLGWIVRNVGPIGARVDAGTYLTSVLLWPLHLAGWLYALRITGRL